MHHSDTFTFPAGIAVGFVLAIFIAWANKYTEELACERQHQVYDCEFQGGEYTPAGLGND